MDPVPDGSIYFWMYVQGLKHVPFEDVLDAVRAAGKDVRQKDYQNYQNGWYNSSYNYDRDDWAFTVRPVSPTPAYFKLGYEDYEKFVPSKPRNRWVPCNAECKPLFKWSEGQLSKHEALQYPGVKFIGENLKGTNLVVFDVDGDHDADAIDVDLIKFFSKYICTTHCIMKPKRVGEYGPQDVAPNDPVMDLPSSFHLTFQVDRLIPTMHFMSAHLDIIGNKVNGMRYWKNKVWNGHQPVPMTPEIWKDIRDWVERRTNGNDA